MMRKRFAANGIVMFVAAVMSLAAPLASAQDQQQPPAAKTPYTLAEYNAFQACSSQTDPQAKIQSCDDFASKFPNSVLLPLVYQTDYNAYNQLKNYPKTIEYIDKFLAVPDEKLTVIPGVTKEKVTGDRLQALYIRAVAFNQSFNEKDPNAQDEMTKARQAALDGLKVLGELPKPANMTDEQFAQQKKPPQILFNYTAGSAAFQLKDYKAAIDSFNAVLADKPDDAATYFRLGVAYLQLASQQAPKTPQTPATPPNGTTPPTTDAATTATAAATTDPVLNDLYMNGFWALARSIALKGPGEAQMRTYLRAQMFNYEQPACGTLLDQQMSELIQLAGTTPTRPATYSLPSAADLNKVLQSSNLLLILTDLQAGGDKGKMTWLAVCGQEIPNVVGKIIDMTPGTDSIDFKVFTAETGEQIQAGTTANLDVTVFTAAPAGGAATPASAGGAQAAATPPPVQPEAARLQKGDAIKFTGTLLSYDTQPFLVHFDKCKVDASVIPPEKGAPKRRPHRPGTR
ncbi:MAG: tetratricopeptide repeat protein [Candidatus Acidiferrales bacterium]